MLSFPNISYERYQRLIEAAKARGVAIDTEGPDAGGNQRGSGKANGFAAIWEYASTTGLLCITVISVPHLFGWEPIKADSAEDSIRQIIEATP